MFQLFVSVLEKLDILLLGSETLESKNCPSSWQLSDASSESLHPSTAESCHIILVMLKCDTSGRSSD